MSNENDRNNDESLPAEPTPDPLQSDPATDETVQVNNFASASYGETIELPDQQGTVVPDEHATIIPDKAATIVPENPQQEPVVTDPEATIVIEQTVDEDRTVADRLLGQTIQARSSSSDITQVDADSSLGSSPPRQTLISRGGLKSSGTVAVSIMASKAIDVTINPRDLSEQDAADWNSAVGAAGRGLSSMEPAIYRTFSDEAFRRLRIREVAESLSSPQVSLDYELGKRIGSGGMGEVFDARQMSLDRRLALKRLKPLDEVKRAQLKELGTLESTQKQRHQQFLSEAIVTSDLDHPNIVPIHDVAFSSKGELFYSMKQVEGIEWAEKIKTNSRDENLEILMKVCDAIGFAHKRGVVHRDIKPQNIMLAEFGVVLVMDWGLALPTPNYEKAGSILATSGLGGTPAFMPPEMAQGPIDRIGPAADIYLLGAVLFLIVTGHTPHQGRNVTECMLAVRQNIIREVPEEKQGELLKIALRAMMTNPKDRYSSVLDFQQAIRDYRSHAESIALATRANERLQVAKQNRSYSDYSRATFGFEESIKSWSGNDKARRGLAEATLLHATTAYENGDFDLGLSLLDENNSQHTQTIKQLRDGLRERQAQITRAALLRKVAAAMLAFILIGGGIAIAVISREKTLADDAREEAEKQTILANQSADKERQATESERQAKESERQAKLAQIELTRKAENLAKSEAELRKQEAQSREKAEAAAFAEKQAKVAAEDATKVAKDNERKANDAKRDAESEKQRANYEAYVAKVGLAKARLDDNEADGARELLKELQNDARNESWEARWLRNQVNQSQDTEQLESSVTDFSLDPQRRSAVIALANGTVQRLRLTEEGNILNHQAIPFGELTATAVSVSPKDDAIAIGTRTGNLIVVNTDGTLRKLDEAHDGSITDVQFTATGLLISGSNDRTVRIWNTDTGKQLTSKKACWHLAPVQKIASVGSDNALMIAVATTDGSVGTIAVWAVDASENFSLEQIGSVSSHPVPVSAIALSSDGKFAASGDVAGNVLLWSPLALQPIDVASSIENALAGLEGSPNSYGLSKQSSVKVARLADVSDEVQEKIISTSHAAPSMRLAHTDIVKSIRFSNDGKSLLTASDDYTLKLWDVSSRQLTKAFKGHGGWVVGADFLDSDNSLVISASDDSTVRSWNSKTYVGAVVENELADFEAKDANQLRIAHADRISTARFSPSGNYVVTSSSDRTARVLAVDPETLRFRQVAMLDDRDDANSDEEILREGTPYVAMSMEVDSVRNRVYLGNADATIRIWDLERGVELAHIPQSGLNTTFSVANDSTRLLCGSSSPDENAVLWALNPTGASQPRRLFSLAGHDEAISAMAISPDGKLLFTGDRGGYGLFWDAATGKPKGEPLNVLRGYRINAATFSADSRELWIGADDEQLSRINVASRERTMMLNHDGFVTQFSLSGDGAAAMTLSELTTEKQLQTTATLWDVKSNTSRVLDRIQTPIDGQAATSRTRHRISTAKFDRQDKVAIIGYAATTESAARVKVLDLQEPSLAGQTFELPRTLGNCETMCPIDAKSLLTMNENGAFRWNLADGKLLKSYREHARLMQADFSFDNQYVVTASRSVKIWNAQTGQAISKLESPHLGPVRSVVMSPIGSLDSPYLLATSGDDGIVRTWHWRENSAEIKLLDEYSDKKRLTAVNRVCFDADGKRLLAVGVHGSAVVWTLDGSQPPQRLSVSKESEVPDFVSGSFALDGITVAVGGTDANVYVWQLTDLNSRTNPVVLSGHAGTVNDVSVLGTASGLLRVFSVSADDTLRVWDPQLNEPTTDVVRRGREVLSLRRHKGDVTAVDLTKEGHLLMTAGNDGTVMLWPAK